jgi:hypothetical protein
MTDSFSKHDYACMQLLVPKADDLRLNQLIVRARRYDLTSKAMAGLLANTNHRAGDCTRQASDDYRVHIATESKRIADAVMKELG